MEMYGPKKWKQGKELSECRDKWKRKWENTKTANLYWRYEWCFPDTQYTAGRDDERIRNFNYSESYWKSKSAKTISPFRSERNNEEKVTKFWLASKGEPQTRNFKENLGENYPVIWNP